MQLKNKQTFITFAVVVCVFGLTGFAQQDDKPLLTACFKAHDEEFQPLAAERAAIYQDYSNRTSSIRSILRWLEQDPKTADTKRLKEIAALEARLQALRENANLTNADAIKNVAKTVEATNVMLEDIRDERDDKVKPFARRLSALQRKHKPEETKLKPIILKFFREKGDTEAIADVSKSYGSFSYSSGTASATYKRPDQNQSAAICYIYLISDKVGQQKYGMFRDKYPIAYRSNHQLEVMVGRSRITIYSSDPKMSDQQLDATLTSLVDIESLEKMLAP